MLNHPQPLKIFGAPIDCTGRFTGVERMPAALRAAGLAERLAAHDQGDLPIAIADPRRDPATGIIGFADVCAVSEVIRDVLAAAFRRGERPLVVGGCCTLLIGVAAALKLHWGRVGLAFVDGHLDFYDGISSPTGEAADMELAIITGNGPAGLVDLAGAGERQAPLVDPADVFVLGYRDGEQAASDGAANPKEVAPKMVCYDADVVRLYGCGALGASVEERFRFDPGQFWLHLDLDVLDQTVMPAVDYPMPGGLTWEEAAALLRPLAQSPSLIGMDVTILNPTLDPAGQYARRTVELLADILGSAAKLPDS
jgi:arginase